VPDTLDRLLFEAFPGLVIRKDLTQAIRGMSKAPSYVIEFMLGKYCANLFDDRDVKEGLQLVQEEVAAYIPRSDETEVIKSQIRERPPRRLIDVVKVELNEKIDTGVYWATLGTANIRNVNISPDLVQKYERLLMEGVWSNILVSYDESMRYGGKTYPFVITRLEPVQVGQVSLEEHCAGRARFTRDQWIDALIRTMGYEPTHAQMTARVKLLYLIRLIALVESNYHMIELGPRQTGKSFCFTEFSPYGTLLGGGAVTVPKLFVSNTSPARPGLVAHRDVGKRE
jgi:ATP-dependent Lon protease